MTCFAHIVFTLCFYFWVISYLWYIVLLYNVCDIVLQQVACYLTAPMCLVQSWVWVNQVLSFTWSPCGFPLGSQDSSHLTKHANSWTDYSKLPLGVNHHIHMCVPGVLLETGVSSTTTLIRIKWLLIINKLLHIVQLNKKQHYSIMLFDRSGATLPNSLYSSGPSWCITSAWSILHPKITRCCWGWPYIDTIKIAMRLLWIVPHWHPSDCYGWCSVTQKSELSWGAKPGRTRSSSLTLHVTYKYTSILLMLQVSQQNICQIHRAAVSKRLAWEWMKLRLQTSRSVVALPTSAGFY